MNKTTWTWLSVGAGVAVLGLLPISVTNARRASRQQVAGHTKLNNRIQELSNQLEEVTAERCSLETRYAASCLQFSELEKASNGQSQRSAIELLAIEQSKTALQDENTRLEAELRRTQLQYDEYRLLYLRELADATRFQVLASNQVSALSSSRTLKSDSVNLANHREPSRQELSDMSDKIADLSDQLRPLLDRNPGLPSRALSVPQDFASQDFVNAVATSPIQLKPRGYFRHGSHYTSAAEIVAHDPQTQRLFVVNGDAKAVDVLDIRNVDQPELLNRVVIAGEVGEPNHVAAYDDWVAVAVAGLEKHLPGFVVFLDTEGNELNRVQVGVLPDNLSIASDGQRIVVANEGEPNEDYSQDPEGTITVIDVSGGVASLTQQDVVNLGFSAFEKVATECDGLRLVKPDATFAQDLEPEYTTISPDGTHAWVTLQENNALAIVDLVEPRIKKLVGLGLKNHSLHENAMDACDSDQSVGLASWPVWGMFQPDGIASFELNGEVFLITANEGDAKTWGAFSEETRVADLNLDAEKFPNHEDLQAIGRLGRLKTTMMTGDDDGDGDHDRILTYGGRSFSILDANGQRIYDSGSLIERTTAQLCGGLFNSDQGVLGSLDSRSDDKGPEPECVAVGRVDHDLFAFVGLERVGGVMVFCLNDPRQPQFVTYVNTLGADAGTDEFGKPLLVDSGPEGLLFIPAGKSPTGSPLVVVAFEVSGTTRVFEVLRPTNTDVANAK